MDVIYSMLVAIQEKGGRIKPTHLMYKANLSHKKLVEYVTELMSKKFIAEEQENDHKFYIITAQGNEFLSEYRRLKQFVDSFGF